MPIQVSLVFLFLLRIVIPTVISQDSQQPKTNTFDEQIVSAVNQLPAYENRQRDFLTPEQYTAVTSSVQTFNRILNETTIDYVYRAYTLNQLIHALILLGNDRRYRGFDDEADTIFTTVIQKCDEALRITPHYPWLLYKKGIAASTLGQFAKASDNFRLAIAEAQSTERTCTPEEAKDIQLRAKFELGVALAKNNQHRESRTNFNELLELPGNDYLLASTYGALGHLSAIEGDLPTARAYFAAATKEAVDFSYQIEPLIFSLIFAESAQEKSKLAERLLELVVEAPCEDYDLYWERAVAAFVAWPYVAARREKLSEVSGLQNGSAEELLRFAATERKRRDGGTQKLTALQNAAWFYIGVTVNDDAAKLEALTRAANATRSGMFWEKEHAAALLQPIITKHAHEEGSE